MHTSVLLYLLALSNLAQFCSPLPLDQSAVVEREAVPQELLPSLGEPEPQSNPTIAQKQPVASQIAANPKLHPSSSTSDPIGSLKELRTRGAVDNEAEYPLTHAMLKVIRDAMAASTEELHKRQSNSSTPGSGFSLVDNMSPATQSTMKDVVRLGIALVMKSGAWALSP